jgi:hypothetical protein
MTALDAALGYARGGLPVFPCSAKKLPVTEHGFKDATTDPAQIREWWTRWPHALIGMPTGERTGLAVLDIDMKHGVNGFRTLAALGYADLPETPAVLTPSGGAHLHFERPEGGFRNTVGAHGRGIGAGLDWRCDGGYVVLPSPGSGYVWGGWDYTNSVPLPVPADLMPRQPERCPFTQAGVAGRLHLSMTMNSLAGVVRAVANASIGERNALAFWGACRAGEMVAAGMLDQATAIEVIVVAAQRAGLPEREARRTAISGIGRGGAGNDG